MYLHRVPLEKMQGTSSEEVRLPWIDMVHCFFQVISVYIYIYMYIYLYVCITICAVQECCNGKPQLVGVDDHGYPHLFHLKRSEKNRSLLRRARKPLEIQLGSRALDLKKVDGKLLKLDPISTSWTHIDIVIIVLYHLYQ